MYVMLTVGAVKLHICVYLTVYVMLGNWLSCIYIYIYAFSRRFYPKRLTVHSGYTFIVSLYIISIKCIKFEYVNIQTAQMRFME